MITQPLWIRPNAHPAQIQPIRIPAGHHCNVGHGMTVTVTTACFYQQLKFTRGDVDQIARDILRDRSSPDTVLRITVVVLAPQVVQEGEVLHHPRVCPGVRRQAEDPLSLTRAQWPAP